MRLLITLLISMLVLIALSGCTSSRHETSETQKYTCPMHPEVEKNEPGQCPICGMNLVPREQDRAAPVEKNTTPEGHAAFELSPVRRQMIGVKLGTVEKKPLFKSIRAAGRLAFDPELYFTL